VNAQLTGLVASAIIHLGCVLLFVVPLFGAKNAPPVDPDSVLPTIDMMVSAFQKVTPMQELTEEQIVEPEQVEIQDPEPIVAKTIKKPAKPKKVVTAKAKIKPAARKIKKIIHPKRQTKTAQGKTSQQKQIQAAKPVNAGKPAMFSMLWNTYKQALRSTIQKQRSYPLQSRRRHEQGIVIVKFRVDKRGNVSHIQVKESSGYKRLDTAATVAIQAVGRFKPFPSVIGEMYRDFELPVRFSLY